MKTKLLIVVACLGVAVSTIAQDRPITWPVRADSGHVAWSQASSNCTHTFLDISASGAEISLMPSGAAPAMDDGGAVLALTLPFQFYDRWYTSLVVSSNGYLAFTDALDRDSGGDFSEQCPLPAVPEPGPAVSARVLVLHDDLDGSSSGGRILQRHFAQCPRASDALNSEPCTVIQWDDWGTTTDPTPFDLQAVLYHSSSEVVVSMVATGSLPQGTAALQSHQALSALAPTCAGAALNPAGTTFCFFDPRYPAGGPVADLVVQADPDLDAVEPGAAVQFTATVSNAGPSPVADALVTSSLTADLSCAWTCEASAGSSCSSGPTSGGPIDTIQLAEGGIAAYTVDCSVALSAAATVALAVSAAVPDGVQDPDATNDSDLSAVDIVEALFIDGFENGTTDRWSQWTP